MSLVPFNQELNRFLLVAKNGTANRYRVTWGDTSKSFSAAQLSAGVNLADEFVTNPFSAAFAKVDGAVAAKQEYETRQIKVMFHGPEAKADMAAVEKVFTTYAGDIGAVIHTAAQPSHDWAVREPLTDFGVNATGTLHLLEATRKHAKDVPFIFTSTSKVYGDTPNTLPLGARPCKNAPGSRGRSPACVQPPRKRSRWRGEWG